jgi:hypothetical protein
MEKMVIFSNKVKKVSLKKRKNKLILDLRNNRKICSSEKLKPSKNHWNYSRKEENIEGNAGWTFTLSSSLKRMIHLK